MESKIYFYTVNFYVRRSGSFFTQVVSGTRDIIEKFCDDLKNDESVDSAVAVYVCTISASDSSPVVVKAFENEEK